MKAEPGGDAETATYDLEAALAAMRKARQRRDPLTVTTGGFADRFANNMLRHFGPEQIETVGLALLIVGASLPALDELPHAVLANLVAFAGQRLVDDARAADQAMKQG